MDHQFTHMADFMARLVIRNALFFGRDKVSNLFIPWATYTDPEVAHVGLHEKELQARGEDNRWLACALCNRAKSDQTHG